MTFADVDIVSLSVHCFGMHKPAGNTVAARVRAEAARAQIPAREFAAALGISPAAMSRRMVGTVPFDVEEIQVVAKVLGVSASVLVSDEAAVSS